ncbi:MAG TPA: FAD-dependent oxidoreductase [Actinomycetota bacterium]|nr:FAD-dependent oxidoreductase [Actinomycetota bacterium]
METVVVGAGVMGAATAYALARRGVEVALLERFEVGHRNGSSHGAARIFRFSYHEERYVRMAMDSLPLWRRLERDSGREILSIRGGVDYGVPALSDHLDALRAAGARHEVVASEEVTDRYPFLRAKPGERALLQPDAGIVLADGTLRAFLDASPDVDLREGERVTALRVDGDRAIVETEQEIYSSDVAVVTAGGWAKGLLEGIGYRLDVRVTAETVAYFRTPDEERLPAIIDWRDPPFYALPSPGQGLKVGEFRVGPEVDPDGERPPPSEESIRHMSDWVGERYATVETTPHHAETCLYTNTPDEDFVLDRAGPVVVGSPCSGHGFKFAPLIGEMLADLAQGVRAPAGT